ncbi:hypothetical protein J6590_092534 [Homalodisca vitripennis]|nr:hypothetical protein J6590_092534 [Homalodisca vitripennis]
MSSSSPATPSAIGTAVTRLSAKRSPSHSGTPTGTLTSTAASCRPSPTLLVRSPFEESSPNTTPRTGPLHCSCGLEAENMELKRRIDQLTLRGIKFLTTPSSLTHVLEAELGCFRAEAVKENYTHNNDTKDVLLTGWALVKSRPKRKSKKKKRNPNPANKSSALKPHKTPFTKKKNTHAKNTPRTDPPFPSATSRRHHPPTIPKMSRTLGGNSFQFHWCTSRETATFVIWPA